MMDMSMEQDSMRELTQRRQNLLLELRNYEENQRLASASIAGANKRPASVSSASVGVAKAAEVGMIPAQTQLQTALAINLGTNGKPVRFIFSLYSLPENEKN